MEVLHCPANVKVHFAAGEVQNQFIAAQQLGVVYSLYTCYPWVERMIFDKAKSPIMPLSWQKGGDTGKLIPEFIAKTQKHVIQDSGLFTLMFGSQKAVEKDERLINRWYDGLVEFTLHHGQPVTCVEVDCQRLLGVDKAWEFRERLRRDLPASNRIINVFHLPDGKKGLDRLIEYSDYIAISVPELRFAGKKNIVPMFVLGSLCAYLASQSWDVHVFHKVREHFHAKPSLRWIWNNLSTGTSQIIDTAIYASVAFGIGMGWFFQPGGVHNLIGIMIGQYLLKLGLAILDTPFFYFFTRKTDE